MSAPENLVDGLRRLEPLLADWPHPAAVVGGVAVIARIMPRHTDDIDLVLTIPDGQAHAFLKIAERHGFQHDPDETEAFLEAALGLGLDVIIVDSAFMGQVAERASVVDLGVARLPVASVEDLLLLKLEANRPEDIDDILAIKDAFSASLDMAYVRAVIAPYAAKVRALRDRMSDVPELEIGTVDGFQGREKEAVIVSLVRSNTQGQVGFLSDKRRMNLAWTRARRRLVVVGDGATLASHSFYRKLLDYAEAAGAYRSAWELG